MKTICLYFQVHQPYRLKRYRFFDIGNDHYYYDDYTNKAIMRKIADKCYLPANKILLDLIKEFGSKFKVAFSLSGIVLEQFNAYVPEVLQSFQTLAKTGNVEFLAETYCHSLASLKSKEEFDLQVKMHVDKIQSLFGQTPTVFRNTELVYDDRIGEIVAQMGYKGMLAEGAKHVLGWKSPHYLYYNANNHRLKVLLKDFKLSDDIAFRFSNKSWPEYPLTAEKFTNWINAIPQQEEVVNLFLDYETFGEHQWAESGIFDFLRAFPKHVINTNSATFKNPSEVIEEHNPIAAIHVPYPISWADEERDLTAWLGNELQNEAFNKLYELTSLVEKVKNPEIQRDWKNLQASDHFYYMCTKFFSDGDVHMYFNPFNSPYDAFINYMNILSDFIERVKKAPKEEDLDDQIKQYEAELEKLKEKAKVKAKNVSSTVIRIDGRMTVQTLKEQFKEKYNATLRIYKGATAGRGAKKAEDELRLGQIADENANIAKLGELEIREEMTIAEFEKEFKDKFNIAVQVASAANRKLADNSMKLSEVKDKKSGTSAKKGKSKSTKQVAKEAQKKSTEKKQAKKAKDQKKTTKKGTKKTKK